jgi:hypothetical protein
MSVNTANQSNTKAPVTAIKELELVPGSTFTANGRKYTVSGSFAIGRLEQVNLMEEELGMFANRSTCHKVMLHAMELINDSKPGQAYVELYNKLQSDQKNAKLMHFTIRVCTAYINYEGEDLGYLTDEQIQAKINDWSMEGLDVRPFMHFAMKFYHELYQHYGNDILNILTQVKSLKESLSQEHGINNSTEKSEAGPAAS